MAADVTARQPIEVGEQPSHSHTQIAAVPSVLSVSPPEIDSGRLNAMTADVIAHQPIEVGEQPSHSHTQTAAVPSVISVSPPQIDRGQFSAMTVDCQPVNHSRSMNNYLVNHLGILQEKKPLHREPPVGGMIYGSSSGRLIATHDRMHRDLDVKLLR